MQIYVQPPDQVPFASYTNRRPTPHLVGKRWITAIYLLSKMISYSIRLSFTQYVFIERYVFRCHLLNRKAPLDAAPDSAPVELANTFHGSYRFIQAIDDQAIDAVLDYFGHGTTTCSDYRGSASHSFYNQKTNGSSKLIRWRSALAVPRTAGLAVPPTGPRKQAETPSSLGRTCCSKYRSSCTIPYYYETADPQHGRPLSPLAYLCYRGCVQRRAGRLNPPGRTGILPHQRRGG